MNTKVLLAVFKRNFVSYFTNPTGYVFMLLYVVAAGIAAFWPNDFFNANLANLNQLNQAFPWIMLVFVPAITMAIWADERRQGTDELLLTIPADDLAIVAGKYLAAACIWTVALLYALAWDAGTLVWLSQGQLDLGLILANYFGYWLVGLAMLSVGMVASFLTGNLTVSYVLGVVLNLPLVVAVYADTAIPGSLATAVKEWSIGEQLRDFGRGVISLSGIAYFAVIVAAMLYLSMVLIGRRHWWGGRDGHTLVWHYLARALALVVAAAGLVIVTTNFDVRWDATRSNVSSLSRGTTELLSNLKLERPVLVDAFVSAEVPESYVETKLNLQSMLRELEARGRGKVQVQIHQTELYSPEAQLAEESFGIAPRRVAVDDRGRLSLENLYMGVAFRSGLEKVIVPFIDRGIPIEYELARSLATVAEQKRKKVGVVRTDAPLFGQFDMSSMSPGSDWPIVAELKKQYDVEEVDPSQPIGDGYDALLAVQPSSLGPEELNNFVEAVRRGVPTAVFEDPLPVFAGNVPGTSQPRRPPGGMNPFMMQQQPLPKGEIATLWESLGVEFDGDKIVWQDYNPYRKASQFPDEFVFIDSGATAGSKLSRSESQDEEGGMGVRQLFNANDPVVAKLQQVLFPFPGAIGEATGSELEFIPLIKTGDKTGTVRFEDLVQMTPFGPRGLNDHPRRLPTGVRYVVAAEIRGKTPAAKSMADDEAAAPEGEAAAEAVEEKPAVETPAEDAEEAAPSDGEIAESEAEAETESAAEPRPIRVILVADIDMLTGDFFRLREQGSTPEADINFNFDNVTFILNTLDSLAGDERFVEIRNRRPRHATLTLVDAKTERARQDAVEKREKFEKDKEEQEKKIQQEFDKKIEDLRKRKNVDPQQALIEVAMAQESGQRQLDAQRKQIEQQMEKQMNRINTELSQEVERVQNRYKQMVWPRALPLLLIGIAVYFVRRRHEREGVAASRLR